MSASPVTRRDALLGAGALAACAGFKPAIAAEQRTLGALAASKGVLFGASLMTRELDRPHGAKYAEMYTREARIITSDIELKASVLRPAPDVTNWEPADSFVAFAEKHGMRMRGHTLIWNDDLPKWIGGLGQGELGHFMDSHIETVMRRYAGKIDIWDVVNEPIAPWDHNEGNLRGGAYFNALGEDYIARAFRAARTARPGAKLVINEAQMEPKTERAHTFRTSFVALLKRLRDAGAPIDAIGFQAHLRAVDAFDFPAFAAYVSSVADLGYEIHITELDVNDSGVDGSIAERDAKVAKIYGSFLTAVLAVPAVRIVETWQLSDATTWLRDPYVVKPKDGVRPDVRPLIYDDRFEKKSAWDAVARAFEAAPIR